MTLFWLISNVFKAYNNMQIYDETCELRALQYCPDYQRVQVCLDARGYSFIANINNNWNQTHLVLPQYG